MGLTAITLMATVLGINESSADALRNPKPNQPVIGAYYANWETGDHPISEIPADSITNLYYSFGGITDGVCDPSSVPAADVTALRALKAAHPKLQVSISIGGWGAGGFSDAALTDASRKKFVGACLNTFFGTYKGTFDGVD
ncbi:MAG: chitinase, partial [Streptomyces sp.]|nr:chitinase [Streptomyces sp.]